MTTALSIRPSLAALAAAALLAACGSNVKLDEKAPVETRTPSSQATGPASPGAAGGAAAPNAAQSQVTTVDLSRNAAAATLPPEKRIVYFDFDSFVVKDEFRPVVEANAKLLTAQPQKRVVIEGHTDERGGREYNLALGQKRAEAVARALKLLGVQDGQMEPVSFGEERPAAQGSDEAAWSRNRRAELKDR